MKISAIQSVLAVLIFAVLCSQTSLAAESTERLYKQCQGKQSTAEQRECYPKVVKQSESELSSVEKKVRDELVTLEKESEGSRSLHPVKAFDKAASAYREFRTAENNRVLTSYGSGNGGGLAAYQATIEMNLLRIKQLNGQ